MIPVSPAWPVAAERIQEREMVGGKQWRAGNGPPGGKAHRSQQSLGQMSGTTEEPAERHPEESPSRSPHPRRCPLPGCGVASAPLTKTVHFRLVLGTHFLLHLSDLIMPPCNFRLGLLCLPSPHFSLWPQSSFFFWQTIYGQQAELTA